MLFVILFWIAIFFVVMRLLTWVARRHPKARNAAAFLVETGAALAVWEALADAGAATQTPSLASVLVMRAVFFGLVGAAAHFLAGNTATSPHVLYPQFAALGLAAFARLPFPWLRWPIGLGMLAVGCFADISKYLSRHRSKQSVAPRLICRLGVQT